MKKKNQSLGKVTLINHEMIKEHPSTVSKTKMFNNY